LWQASSSASRRLIGATAGWPSCPSCPRRATIAYSTSRMEFLVRVARAVQAVFDPPGLTLLQANGREGDQTVFHFHLHVVPRHADDGIALSWPRKEPAAEVLRGYALQLGQALQAAG
jgi:diadenosine tetraphosphate (Ap4A) HIT family hydrolase